jgi:hypothetical protein
VGGCDGTGVLPFALGASTGVSRLGGGLQALCCRGDSWDGTGLRCPLAAAMANGIFFDGACQLRLNMRDSPCVRMATKLVDSREGSCGREEMAAARTQSHKSQAARVFKYLLNTEIMNCTNCTRAASPWSPAAGYSGKLKRSNLMSALQVRRCVKYLTTVWGHKIQPAGTHSTRSAAVLELHLLEIEVPR